MAVEQKNFFNLNTDELFDLAKKADEEGYYDVASVFFVTYCNTIIMHPDRFQKLLQAHPLLHRDDIRLEAYNRCLRESKMTAVPDDILDSALKQAAFKDERSFVRYMLDRKSKHPNLNLA